MYDCNEWCLLHNWVSWTTSNTFSFEHLFISLFCIAFWIPLRVNWKWLQPFFLKTDKITIISKRNGKSNVVQSRGIIETGLNLYFKEGTMFEQLAILHMVFFFFFHYSLLYFILLSPFLLCSFRHEEMVLQIR